MSIQFSDIVSLLAITISLLTFGISVYIQFIKPPKLIISPGENLTMYYQNDGSLGLRSNLSFFNLGARYLGIQKITGVITRKSDGLSMGFEWADFFKSTVVKSTGKSQIPWIEFDGPLQTIIVPGYQATNRSITFITERSFEVTPGIYTIEYTAYLIPNRKAMTRHTVQVDKNAATHLSQKCVANDKGVYKESLVLRLQV